MLDPIDSPRELITPPPVSTSRRELEKSAVREAITLVCEAAVGEKGSKLLQLLERIEAEDGPKAAFDSIVKLLEYSTPRLQRVTVQDPDGNAPQMPIININFQGTNVKLVEEVRELPLDIE